MEVVHGGTGAIELDDVCDAVAGNNIKDVGAKAIGEGLKHNSSLQTLKLEGECTKGKSMQR
jgi:hypothetical protein